MIEELLVDAGYEVRTAAHGESALTVLAEWHPDLILLDMRMPVMDGKAFRHEQLAHPDWRAIPVVVMSATERFLAEEETVGAKAVLAKPFEFDDLLALVQEWVGRA
jgi:CheY-like chemotaxis protein